MFYLSAQSSAPEFLPSFWLSDKFLHGLEYSIFGALIFHAIQSSPTRPETLMIRFILSLSIVLLYGISDEFHQSFVPYRDASSYDVLADVVGGTVGIFFANKLIKRRSNHD